MTRKRHNYREIGDKFKAGASTPCEKVNTTSIDENLFRLLPVPGPSARVLPVELMPVPEHGAQNCVWAPTKGYVQTSARSMNGP